MNCACDGGVPADLGVMSTELLGERLGAKVAAVMVCTGI